MARIKTPAPGPYEVVVVEADDDGLQRGRLDKWVMIRNADGAIATVYPSDDSEATARLLAASWKLLKICEDHIAGLDPAGLRLDALAVVAEIKGV